MATPQRSERRTVPLTRARIVEAAMEILDADGEDALTFRALAARLSTGSGAIYHHVDNKSELLTAATDHIIDRVVSVRATHDDARHAIRSIALGVFDAIDDHPWVGTQLSREPWRTAMLQIYENIGVPLRDLGVPDVELFDCASAMVSYILGVAGQNAANARLHPETADRGTFLDMLAGRWEQLDAEAFPFVIGHIAPALRDHDDREQFLAGVDIFLAGVAPR